MPKGPRHNEASPHGTTRVQLELPPKSYARLARLKEQTEASSYAEVCREALQVYEALAREIEAGGTIHVKKKDGESCQLVIFGGW